MRASASGAFSATVPAPFGTSVITVAATKGNATGYARRTVISEFITGTTVLDVTDPDGDDNGPGTYAYPTSDNFKPGAFDLQRFQVIVDGDNVLLRAKVRDLSPTFGSPLGAQLLDVYVHTPAAARPRPPRRSRPATTRSRPTRPGRRRIEVQGFADPVFVDASGASLGTVSVQASQASGFITAIVPLAALGTPGRGLGVHGRAAPARTGSRPTRPAASPPTPQDFQFGVCAAGRDQPDLRGRPRLGAARRWTC